MTARRGTSNGNSRGSSYDRARRKAWLMKHWAVTCDKTTVAVVRCWCCGDLLFEKDMTVDRIIPGCKGGKYVRGNIRPACAACNSEHGGALRGN